MSKERTLNELRQVKDSSYRPPLSHQQPKQPQIDDVEILIYEGKHLLIEANSYVHSQIPSELLSWLAEEGIEIQHVHFPLDSHRFGFQLIGKKY